MKKVLLLTTIIFFIATSKAQISYRKSGEGQRDFLPFDSTGKLPKGTAFNNGDIILNKEFVANYADNQKVLIIKNVKTGSNTGAFSCYCKHGAGSCSIGIDGNKIICFPEDGCTNYSLTVVVDLKNTTIKQSGLGWKKLIVPNANMQHQKTEDPDQGGEIIKKKNIQINQ